MEPLLTRTRENLQWFQRVWTGGAGGPAPGLGGRGWGSRSWAGGGRGEQGRELGVVGVSFVMTLLLQGPQGLLGLRADLL